MILQEEIQLAREFCIKAHAGQFRRDGVTPYHTHPMAVADAVPDELKPAALLHDVVEDCAVSFEQLKVLFSNRTVSAVFFLTRKHPCNYGGYIKRMILYCPDAVKIKIADMEHNLSCQPSENSKKKIAKWLPILKAKEETNK